MNGELLDNMKLPQIISNPNCSVSQLLVAIKPIHDLYKVKRVDVATYQSVSGTGQNAVKQLENEERGINQDRCYQHQIHRNVIPQLSLIHISEPTRPY